MITYPMVAPHPSSDASKLLFLRCVQHNTCVNTVNYTRVLISKIQ